MSSENASVEWETPFTVTGELVSLERKLANNTDDVIATLEVTLKGDDPVEVEIVDTVPDSWEVAEVGIHPQHMPRDFEANNDGFKFIDVVTADEPLEIVYGVRLETPGSIPPPNPPTIEREELAPDSEADTSKGFLKSDPEVPADEPEMAESFHRGGSSPETTEKPPIWDQESDESGETEGLDEPQLGTRETGLGESLDAGSRAGDPLEDDRLLGRDGSLLGEASSDENLAEALAEEIESGTASEEALETIRETLKVEGSQRDSVRLNHLQSRVEEFAAYAEALGDVIDEHGPLDEFLSDQKAKIDDREADHEVLSGRVDEMTSDIETVQNRLSALDERIEAVDDVADDVEEVRNELDQLRSHHGDDIRDLESAIDDLETSYDEARDELTSELEELRSEVERWDSTRKRIARALEPDDEFNFGSNEDA